MRNYSVAQVFFEEIFYGLKMSRKLDDGGCNSVRMSNPENKLIFSSIAYLQEIIANKKRGIPALGPDFASFANLVGSTLQMSNFLEDYEAIWTARNFIENIII